MLPRHPRRRAGMTMVELLVVIAIIALLAALLVGALVRVRDTAKELQVRSDFSQLDTAIGVFKSKLHIPPPTGVVDTNVNPRGFFRLCSQYATGSSGNWSFIPPFNANSPEIVALARMFPNINFADTGLRRPRPDGTPVSTADSDQSTYFIRADTSSGATARVELDPNQCMVVFLSGGEFTDYTGFATDPAQPFRYSTTGNRMAGTPFFAFPKARMKKVEDILRPLYSAAPGRTSPSSTDDLQRRFPGEDLARYRHPWFVDPWSGGDVEGMPYLYLSSGPNGNAYPTTPVIEAVAVAPWGLPWPAGTEGTDPWFAVDKEQQAPVVPIRGFMPLRESNRKFINPTTWQIVSAGRDNKFGPGSALLTALTTSPAQYRDFKAASPPYSQGNAGGDDFANFHPRKLAND